MTNNRLQMAMECSTEDHVPFVPAVYEHKAWFVNETPSNVSRDVGLFTKAVLAEFETIRPDAITIGIDVYNVEAEALGCKVIYYDGDDTSVPAIGADGAAFTEQDDFASIGVPDPQKDGRMPINLEVAKNVVKILSAEVPIRGALSGPFSMAANLVGPAELFMLTVTNPTFVNNLLLFASNVVKRFGDAYIKAGCGVIIFDSQASPDLLSPKMYREFVLQPTKSIIDHFHKMGVKNVPLIIGGNTTKILDAYLESGANNILCDSTADVNSFVSECSKVKRAFRKNIDSSDFLVTCAEDIHKRALAALEESRNFPGYILGTSVVPYGTPLENLIAVRDAVHEFNNQRRGYLT